MFYIDNRWDGNHGIGRFAREVSSRIGEGFRPLSGSIKPSSALDPLLPARLRLSKSDLVYSPGYNCGLSFARQVITIHDLIHLDDSGQASRAKRAYYDHLVKPTIKRAGLVHTVSETSRQRILEWLSDEEVEVKVVGNGSSDSFTPSGVARAVSAPTFAYVGNLRSHKNVLTILQALALRPDYRMIAVVPDVADANLLFGMLGVSGQVDAVSGVDDDQLAEIYRSATATLLPSTLEGFGFPALESYLCGVPTLYWSGCESIAEISGGSGIAVAGATDVEEWANALDTAVRDRGSLLRDDASAWRKRYDWDGVAQAVRSSFSERF